MAKSDRPRLLIEDWLPAAAIGVECIREEGQPSAKPPTTYLHVWWARRPLTASRAAVLASLLPASFDREKFEHLMGFGRPSSELVAMRRIMDSGVRLGGFGCDRAFKAKTSCEELASAHQAMEELWGGAPVVIDPMCGGGSIPFESLRMGLATFANEYNPVACSVTEVTACYAFKFGPMLFPRILKWGNVLREALVGRVGHLFPKTAGGRLHRPDGYIFARTVPCPDTAFMTPLVPDWHLAKPRNGRRVVAAPFVDKATGTWTVQIREIGTQAGQVKCPPRPTYSRGKGISLFAEGAGGQIRSEYIKAMAQQGRMTSRMYAVVLKTPQGLIFEVPSPADVNALAAASAELEKQRSVLDRSNSIPTELYPEITTDERPRAYGMPRWTDMFSPRQLVCFGALMEILRERRPAIMADEGEEIGEAVFHLLGFAIDKMLSYNNTLASWHAPRQLIRGIFDRHDFSFKPTFTEMAVCNEGMGLDWAIRNVAKAYRELAELADGSPPAQLSLSCGSATQVPAISDKSITAVVVDPPYADNVQYSELADFFYVWLKRTQGHRRPEWFSTYLCEHDQEAVVCPARHRKGKMKLKEAKAEAHEFYQKLMTDIFRECHRILRDDGVLTVMFTHKKQEAWEALFDSLIRAGFTITATWPVKTESEHSLHQAKKNAAQSTVILVSRKRPAGAGVGYYDARMQEEVRQAARNSAERMKGEGLNAVDQLVGSFGPAMEVYSRHDEVRTDTGDPVAVGRAIDEASDAVTRWRIEQLAARGLEGVEPEGQFYLLCWDVLQAAEFRYNEAHLLGKAVGMDVDELIPAGLVSKSGESIKVLPASERRRGKALTPDEVIETLFGTETVRKKRTKKDALKVHPNDPQFRTALDGCHALALRYVEAKGGAGGVGSAKALVRTQGWGPDSAVAKLMEALVKTAPEAVKFEKGKQSAAATFPEFRAWHELLKPLFDIEPPEWKERKAPVEAPLFQSASAGDGGEEDDEDQEEIEGDDE